MIVQVAYWANKKIERMAEDALFPFFFSLGPPPLIFAVGAEV